MGLSSIALALLAVASATSTCEEGGRADFATYSAALSVYYAETALLGGSIGQRSEGCKLPITPEPSTFQIWQYINSQQTALATPGSLTKGEMHHLTRTLEASSEWLRSFVGDGDGGNVKAAAALATMECHLRRAAQIACEEEPREVACCAHTQYHTWVRVARVLADLVAFAYGERCGTARASDDAVRDAFASRFGAIVDTIPDDGVRGAARQSAEQVLAWAWRGVCGDHGCPQVNASISALRALDTLSRQGPLAWAGGLLCAPRWV